MKKFLKITGGIFFAFFAMIFLAAVFTTNESSEKVEEKVPEVEEVEEVNVQEETKEEVVNNLTKEEPVKEEPVPEPVSTGLTKQEAFDEIKLQMLSPSSSSAKAYGEIVELTSMIEDTPILMLDPDWKFAIGFQLGIVKGAGKEFTEVNVDSDDPDVQYVLSKIHEIGDKMIRSSDLTATGVDNMDMDSLSEGARLTGDVASLTKEVQGILK